MGLTKEQVEQHIANVDRRLTSAEERKKHGYMFAKLCYQVENYESAIRYLSGYLTLNEKDVRAQKLMGRLYSEVSQSEKALVHYERSLELKDSQKDVVTAIAELYCKLERPPAKGLKAALRSLRALLPSHRLVLSLNEKLRRLESGHSSVEELLTQQLALRSDDTDLHVRLVRLYSSSGRLAKAFEYCQMMVSSRPLQESLLWQNCALQTAERHYEELKLSGCEDVKLAAALVAVLEGTSLVFELLTSSHYTSSMAEYSTLLIKYDKCLFALLLLLRSLAGDAPTLYHLAARELAGRLYHMLAQTLFLAGQHGTTAWKLQMQLFQLAEVCLLASLKTPPPVPEGVWSGGRESSVHKWRDASYCRLSAVGRHLALIAQRKGTLYLSEVVKHISSLDGKQLLIKTVLCENPNLKVKFGSQNIQFSLIESFVAADHSLEEPVPQLPDHEELTLCDKVYLQQRGRSLRALVWLCLAYKSLEINPPVSEWLRRVFGKLKMDTVSLARCDADSICLCDLEAFVVLVCQQCGCQLAGRARELGLGSVELPPPQLVAVALTRLPPCCVELEAGDLEWWSTAVQFLSGQLSLADGVRLKKLVQKCLGLVRACGAVQLSLEQLVELARHFRQRAEAIIEDSEALDGPDWVYYDTLPVVVKWSTHYWTQVTERITAGGGHKPPPPPHLRPDGNPLLSTVAPPPPVLDTASLLQEAQMALASAALHDNNTSRALQLYSAVKTPHAAWNQSQIYRLLAEQSVQKEPAARISNLQRASETLSLALDRLSPSVDHTLRRKLVQQYDEVKLLLQEARQTQTPGTVFPFRCASLVTKTLTVVACTLRYDSGDEAALIPRRSSTPARVGNLASSRHSPLSAVPLSDSLREVFKEKDEQLASVTLQLQQLQAEMQELKRSHLSVSPQVRSTATALTPPAVTPPNPLGSGSYVRATCTTPSQTKLPGNASISPTPVAVLHHQSPSPTPLQRSTPLMPRSILTSGPSVVPASPVVSSVAVSLSPLASALATGSSFPSSSPLTLSAHSSPYQGLPLLVPQPQPAEQPDSGPPPPTMLFGVSGTGSFPSTFNFASMSSGMTFGAGATVPHPPQPFAIPTATAAQTAATTTSISFQLPPFHSGVVTSAAVQKPATAGSLFPTFQQASSLQPPPFQSSFLLTTASGYSTSGFVTSTSTMLPQSGVTTVTAASIAAPIFPFTQGSFAFTTSAPMSVPRAPTSTAPPLPSTTTALPFSLPPFSLSSLTSAPFTIPQSGMPTVTTTAPFSLSSTTTALSFSLPSVLASQPATTAALPFRLSTTSTSSSSSSSTPFQFGGHMESVPTSGLPTQSAGLFTGPIATSGKNTSVDIQPPKSTSASLFTQPEVPPASSLSSSFPLLSSLLASPQPGTAPPQPGVPTASATSTPLFQLGSGATSTASATSTPLFQLGSGATSTIFAPSLSKPADFDISSLGFSTQPLAVPPAFLESVDDKDDDGAAGEKDQSLDTSGSAGPDFAPIVSLPKLEDVRSGEENEEVLFCHRAKLFRFVSGEWKERGLGDIKILKNIKTTKVRLVMRREQILKLCCNHYLTADTKLTTLKGTTHRWVWHTLSDLSEDVAKEEKFAIKFKQNSTSEEFKEVFEDCVQQLGSTQTTAVPTTTEPDSGSPLPSESLLAKFAPPPRSWTCSTCLIQNTASASKCVACGGSNTAAKSSESLLAKFSPPPGSWTCNTCLLPNKSSATVCIACSTSKVPVAFSNVPKSSDSSAPASGFKLSSPLTLPQTTGASSGALASGGMKIAGLNLAGLTAAFPSLSAGTPEGGMKLGALKLTSLQPPSSSIVESGDTSSSESEEENYESDDEHDSSDSKPASVSDDSAPPQPEAPVCGGLKLKLPSSFDFKFQPPSSDAVSPKAEAASPSEEVGGHDTSLEREPDVFFKPAVVLPESYQTATGEENEVALFSSRSKLFRFDATSKQWKERGIGEMKILRNTKSGRFRVLMRREQVRKVCCNHFITPGMTIGLQENSDKALIWGTSCDFADQTAKPEQFALKFKLPESAQEFKRIFEDCVVGKWDEPDTSGLHVERDQSTGDEYTNSDEEQDDTDIIVTGEDFPSQDKVELARKYKLPPTFFNYEQKQPCPGCRGCEESNAESDPASVEDEHSRQEELSESNPPTVDQTLSPEPSVEDASKTHIPFSASTGMSFAGLAESTTQGSFAFGKSKSPSGFTGAGRVLFGSHSAEDGDPQSEANVHFQPLVSLPEVNLKTGEEKEVALFSHRAKLYRFDAGQWKERGVGDIKILKNSDTDRCRVLMRREQIFKICCNHAITPGMALISNAGNEKSWIWSTPSDFADEVSRPEKLAVKFRHVETAKEFKDAFELAAQSSSNVAMQSAPQQVSSASTSSADIAQRFAPPPGSWVCQVCSISNLQTVSKCVACGSANPDGAESKPLQEVDGMSCPPPQPDAAGVASEPLKFPLGVMPQATTPTSPSPSLDDQPPQIVTSSQTEDDYPIHASTDEPGAATPTRPAPQSLDDEPGAATPTRPAPQSLDDEPGAATPTSSAPQSLDDEPGAATPTSPAPQSLDDEPGAATPTSPAPQSLDNEPGATTPTSPAPQSLDDEPGAATPTRPAPQSLDDEPGAATPTSPAPQSLDSEPGAATPTSPAPQSLDDKPGATSPAPQSLDNEPGATTPTSPAPQSLDDKPGATSPAPQSLDNEPGATTPTSRTPESLDSEPGATTPASQISDNEQQKPSLKFPLSMEPRTATPTSPSPPSPRVRASPPHTTSLTSPLHFPLDFEPRTATPTSPVEQQGEAQGFTPEWTLQSDDTTEARDGDEAVFCCSAELFHDDNKWIGRGIVKIFLNEQTDSKSIKMISESAEETVLCSHAITSLMRLRHVTGKEASWIWTGFKPESSDVQKYCVQFESTAEAEGFKKNFSCLPSPAASQSAISPSQAAERSRPDCDKLKQLTAIGDSDRVLFAAEATLQSSDLSLEGDLEIAVQIIHCEATGVKRIILTSLVHPSNVVCAHEISPTLMRLRHLSESDDTSWMWTGYALPQASEPTAAVQRYSVLFASTDEANRFYQSFTSKQLKAPIPRDSILLSGTDEDKHSVGSAESDVEFLHEELPDPELVEKARQFMLPASFYLYLQKPPCPGCRGCMDEPPIPQQTTVATQETPVSPPITTAEDYTAPATQETCGSRPGDETGAQEESPSNEAEGLHSGSSPGLQFDSLTIGMLSFSDVVSQSATSAFPTSGGPSFKFHGAGKQLFGMAATTGDDDNPEAEADVTFRPVVTLPESYSTKSWDDDATALFTHRAKLFRYDSSSMQWKERGVGDVKILKHNQTGKYRIIMRRDQIYKICCNHYITVDMQLLPGSNEKSWVWSTLSDLTDNEPKEETLAIRFKHQPTAEAFRHTFDECVENLRTNPLLQSATVTQEPLELMFKPTDGEWTCSECYVPNKREDLACVACSSPRNTEDSKSDQMV